MSDKNEWNEDLFGCFNDLPVCLYGCWCTPCLFGSNAKKISNKNWFQMCCLYAIATNYCLCCIPHLWQRKKLRKKYNLKRDACDGCPKATCCGPCALCQEARELQSRAKKPDATSHVKNGAPIVHQPVSHSTDVEVINTRL